MPVQQDVRNDVATTDLNGKPKRNRYSLKKLLDKSRFSPRLLRLVKPCKSLNPGKPVSTDKLVTVQQVADDKQSGQVDTVDKVKAVEKQVVIEKEEEYEESLAHFTERILDNVRTANNCSQPPLADGEPGMNTVDQASEVTSFRCDTSRQTATTPPVSYIGQAGSSRGGHRYELTDQILSQQLPAFSIYNEPCDAKPDFNLSGPTVPVYTSTGELKLTDGDQINLISPSHGLTNHKRVRSPLPSVPTDDQSVKPLSHHPMASGRTTSPNSPVTSDGSLNRDQPAGGKITTEPSPNLSGSSSCSLTSPIGSPASAILNAGTVEPATQFVDLPRGNTVIVHHASSPFARVPRHSASPQLSGGGGDPADNGHLQPCGATTVVHIGRQERALSPPSPSVKSTGHGIRKAKSVEPQHLPAGQTSSSVKSEMRHGPTANVTGPHHRAEPTPTYEEAWDIKMTRQLGFGIDQLAGPTVTGQQTISSTTTVRSNTATGHVPPAPPHNSGVQSVNRHQHSPNHRTYDNQYPADSGQNQVRRTGSGGGCSNLRFYENKLFEKGKSERTTLVALPEISPTGEYDYAYNESWSMGVQRNLDLSLGDGGQTSVLPTDTSRNSLRAPHQGNRQSGRDGLGTSPASHQSYGGSGGSRCSGTDADFHTHSTDSCDDVSWEAKHGRGICELTGGRAVETSLLPPGQQAAERRQPDGARSPQHHLSSLLPSSSSSQTSSIAFAADLADAQSTVIPANGAAVCRRKGDYLPLEEQPWFHPQLTRAEAEEILRNQPEGSFLVRTSETCPNDYSLSIKHRTHLHMKISRTSTGHFILGEYSQPYPSVPHMIRHYAFTQVPVRGAESVTLMHPVGRRPIDTACPTA